MQSSREIIPVSGPIHARIRPPGSKSITNRALVVAALAEGCSRLSGVLDSQDTRVMFESLSRLGIPTSHDPDTGTASVTGTAGVLEAGQAELDLHNSGTSIRFLTAMVATGRGRFRLDGIARMRERPIRDLTDALGRLGSRACCSATGCPPVDVDANGLPGGTTHIAGNISSQFLSALLMAAPAAQNAVELQIDGELVSKPYVDMTIGVMSAFGVNVETEGYNRFRIAPQVYQAREYNIEPDASAASYFLAAAAITGGEVTVDGLSRESLQGDVDFANALQQMGCEVTWGSDSVTVRGGPLRGIDIDMNAISDTAQTLAVVAPFAQGPTQIRSVGHMRHKETDRIDAIADELRRTGIDVETDDDGLIVHPGTPQPADIQTYDDHRMAMSFALLGLRVPGIRILDPECTSKTYPRFFDDLDRVCGRHS